MMPPELQRILLLVGLAATAYLLILAWNRDYGQDEIPVERDSAPAIFDADTLVPTDPDEEAQPRISDVPDPSLLDETDPADVATTRPTPAETPTNRLIEVRTPRLHVWIDRLGGDIIRVELPLFPVSRDRPDVPFQLLDNTPGRLYVSQSGLTGPDGIDTGESRPLFDVDQNRFEFTDQPGEVVLRFRNGAAEIDKVFVFDPDDYAIETQYRVNNLADEPFRAALFGQIKRGDHDAPGSGAPLGIQPFVGPALTTDDDRYNRIRFRNLRDSNLNEQVDGGWIAMLQHYFLSAWIPDQTDRNRFYGQHRADGDYVVGFIAPQRVIAPGDTGVYSAKFYVGPKDQDRLAELAQYLNLTVDYGFLWWLALPLFKLLQFLHGIVNNWGVAIILLTVVIKILLYPLSAASFKSMANMRRVAPQMKRLQERYADDRQKLSQEMMALYKREKANPLGGCLPMLLQMPVFIALYWVLFESVELRHAPFMLWIQDLSAMDPYFILPILMGVTMYVQQSLNPPVPDPTQAKIMKIMPVFFTAIFLFFPAGLVLYWFVNNGLSILQQYIVNKQVEGKAAASKS